MYSLIRIGNSVFNLNLISQIEVLNRVDSNGDLTNFVRIWYAFSVSNASSDGFQEPYTQDFTGDEAKAWIRLANGVKAPHEILKISSTFIGEPL